MSAQEFVSYMFLTYNKDLKKYLTEFEKEKTTEVLMYTDGATPNNKMSKKINIRGGLGVYIKLPNLEPISISEPVENATNNICELRAIEVAVDYLENLDFTPTTITVFSDSQYCIKALTIWYKNWVGNGWMSSKGTPVENKELIQRILSKLEKWNQLNFKYVKGHSGVYGNEMADALAVAGCSKNSK